MAFFLTEFSTELPESDRGTETGGLNQLRTSQPLLISISRFASKSGPLFALRKPRRVPLSKGKGKGNLRF